MTDNIAFEEINMKALLEAIDNGLSNRYVVLEGDHETLYVKDRETEEHYAIHISVCE